MYYFRYFCMLPNGVINDDDNEQAIASTCVNVLLRLCCIEPFIGGIHCRTIYPTIYRVTLSDRLRNESR